MSSNYCHRLVAHGLSATEAEAKGRLFEAADERLRLRPGEPAGRWFVPGRIEVLGKHTDYCGGPSLLCAAERGMCVVAVRRADHRVEAQDAVSGEHTTFTVSPSLDATTGWANYVRTVARRLARNFPGAEQGARIAFASDLPRGSGMSSSSALVVGIFSALAWANRVQVRPEYAANVKSSEDLAGYLGCIENGQSFGALAGDHGVGTFGGSEDHTAILCSQTGRLALYRFCPVELQRRIPLPADYVFAVAMSGMKAAKTGEARESYNSASLAAAEVFDTLKAASGRNYASLYELVAASSAEREELREKLRTCHSKFDPLRRFDHYCREAFEVIPAAVAALEAGDYAEFGRQVDASQMAAQELLQNQVAETIALAQLAREAGAVATSAFGAGFGGSVWALVRCGEAEQTLSNWRDAYLRQFPARAFDSRFFLTSPGPGLITLSPE